MSSPGLVVYTGYGQTWYFININITRDLILNTRVITHVFFLHLLLERERNSLNSATRINNKIIFTSPILRLSLLHRFPPFLLFFLHRTNQVFNLQRLASVSGDVKNSPPHRESTSHFLLSAEYVHPRGRLIASRESEKDRGRRYRGGE